MTDCVTPRKLCGMAYDNSMIDKRVVERNIAKGLVDPEVLKRQIDSLPDRESNCVHVSLDGSSAGTADAGSDSEDDEAEPSEPEFAPQG